MRVLHSCSQDRLLDKDKVIEELNAKKTAAGSISSLVFTFLHYFIACLVDFTLVRLLFVLVLLSVLLFET